MEKITMLGTGAGGAEKIYNTCFILENEKDKLLVDTGGGMTLVKNIHALNYDLADFKDIFISHCHSDHLLGIVWLIRKLAVLHAQKKWNGKITLYCNREVAVSYDKVLSAVFQEDLYALANSFINVHILEDGDEIDLMGLHFKFFDCFSKSNLLYGFEVKLSNGKKLIFLGDETCNPKLYERINGTDYLMHEAYCLDSEEGIPAVVKIHHTTVKKVCETMNQLDIKNLIIYHTEDSHPNKKELYTKEAQMYFKNNVIIPNDLEVIELK